MRLKHLFSLVITSLLMFSCGSEEQKNDSFSNYSSGDMELTFPELSEEEEREIYTQAQNENQEDRIEFLSSSLRDLDIIRNHWEKEYLLCVENERFVFLKCIETEDSVQNFIALSSKESPNDRRYDYTLYHMDVNGKVINEFLIPNASSHIRSRTNFIQKDDEIYFYTNQDENEFITYNLSALTHLKGPLAFEMKFDMPYNVFESPSKQKKVKLAEQGTYLLLNETNTEAWDTLIKQEYTGSWSIGSASWSESEEKVYFDNSGAVACIWEIDLSERTIDKIVPAHSASNPICAKRLGEEIVIYCQDDCIKIAKKEDFNPDF